MSFYSVCVKNKAQTNLTEFIQRELRNLMPSLRPYKASKMGLEQAVPSKMITHPASD